LLIELDFFADDVPERWLRQPVLQLGPLWLRQRTAAANAKLAAFRGAHVPQHERQRVHEHDHGIQRPRPPNALPAGEKPTNKKQ
jgi:hypothetical protein